MMGVRIDGPALERQLAERGRTKAELAVAAGVHPATISHCVAGRPIAARTFRALVRALHQMDPLPGGTALLAVTERTGVGAVASAGRAPATQAEGGHASATMPR